MKRPRVFYGWWVLGVTGIMMFFSMGPSAPTITVLIKPMSEEFRSSHAQLLGALTVAGLLGAVMSPVVGRMVDRYGTRVVIASILAVFGLELVLMSRMNSLWQFYLLYGTGLAVSFSGLMGTAAPAVISNWFLRKRGIAIALLSASMASSGFAFPLATQALVDLQDWRLVWLVMGVVLLVLPLPLIVLVVRHQPEDMGLLPDGARALQPGRTLPTERDKYRAVEGSPEAGWTLREAMGTRTFWLLVLGFFLASFPSFSIIVVMHPYYTDLGTSSATAARLVAFYSLWSFIGAFIWGGLAQRFRTSALLVPYALTYGTSIVLLVVVGGSALPLMYLVVVPLGVSIMGYIQLANQVWAEYYGRKELGSILGAAGLARVVPNAIGPLTAGLFHDFLGEYGPAFLLFSGMCFLAALCFYFARPPQGQQV